MQGRGRGSYLGLLLESSGLGKSMVGLINTKEDIADGTKNERLSSANYEDTTIGQPPAINGVGSITTDASPKCSQSTWTSLDLLGNRGRRGRHSKEVLTEQTSFEQDKIEENGSTLNTQSDRAPKDQKDIDPAILNVTTTKRLSPITTASQQLSSPYLPAVAKQVHLSSPEEFMVQSTDCDEKIESASETSNSSGSSPYIPPHRRKGLDEQPETYETAAYDRKKIETRQTRNKEISSTTETVTPETLVESELNWQKWKLQRNFKKILNSFAIDNSLGFGKEIKELIVNSQLSTKFPGISEVNVILEHLVHGVLDKRENVEVAVCVCRLLNAMYPDELPSNLREVLKVFRQDDFAGVSNRNYRCDNFCLFLGKLCDVGKLETKSFQECLKQSVVGCLYEWISPYQNMDEDSHEAQIKVMYLCELLELTKYVMAVIKRSWVKSCFGKIKNCILNDKLPRHVRESLLDAILRHSLQSFPSKQTVIDGKSSADTENNFRLPPAGDTSKDYKLIGDSDMYKDVKKMLAELELGNLLEKFQANLIRDSLLRVEKNELKNTLQEAGFAPGAILEVLLYLEKNEMCFHSNVVDKLTNNESPDHQHSSTSLLDTDSRVKNTESKFQEILGALGADRENTRNSEMEKVFSKSTEKMKHIELDEAKNELMYIQTSLNQQTIPLPAFPSICRPPPGFMRVSKDGLPLGHSPVEKEQFPKREVFLERQKPDVLIQEQSETTNVTDTCSSMSGGNRKSFGLPKHKGRGRGRRDTSGSLETLTSRYPNRAKNEQNEENENYGGLDVSPSQVGSKSGSLDTSRPLFGSSMPIGCFICGSKGHRSAYCKNNAAMFD